MPREPMIDLSKVREEIRRWLRGDLKQISEGYLQELVEIEGADPSSIKISLPLDCPYCGSEITIVPCPECAILENESCSMCGGMGGWGECRNPECPGPTPGQEPI